MTISEEETGLPPAPGYEHESEYDFLVRMTEAYRKAKKAKEDSEKSS